MFIIFLNIVLSVFLHYAAEFFLNVVKVLALLILEFIASQRESGFPFERVSFVADFHAEMRDEAGRDAFCGVVERHIKTMAAFQLEAVFVHRYEERIHIDIIALGDNLNAEAVDFVMIFMLEHQVFSHCVICVFIKNDEVVALDGTRTQQR